MRTLNSLLTELCDAGKIQFEGIHYSAGVPVYTGDLWRIFPRDEKGELNSRQLNRLTDLCESKDIQLRFDDETITDDNGKVHEQNPGYHGQVKTWQYVGDDCELWSQEEAETDQSMYIESLVESVPIRLTPIPTKSSASISSR